MIQVTGTDYEIDIARLCCVRICHDGSATFKSCRRTSSFLGGSGVAVNSKGQVYLLHRGKQPIICVDSNGKFLRSWGDTTIGKHQVLKFSPVGKLLLALGKAGTPGDGIDDFDKPADVAFGLKGEINLPHTIVVDRNGYAVVGDRENDRVQVFESGGKFVADGRANKVLQLDDQGKVVGSWGEEGAEPGQFQMPHMLAVDARGNLYVSEIKGERFQKLVRQ